MERLLSVCGCGFLVQSHFTTQEPLRQFSTNDGTPSGSFLFGEALRLGFGPALAIFSAVQLGTTVAAIPLFRSETASTAVATIGHPGL